MNGSAPLAPQARQLLALGLPLIGSHLAQIALHVTDTILMGRYGTVPLAAVVLATSFFFVLFILGSGFGLAVMGMVASALGRGDEAQVRRDARMGLWLSLIYSLAVLPVFWFSRPILLALHEAPDVSQKAQDFLRIGGLGLAPALLVMVLKSYLAALERAQVVLWVTLAGILVNLGLAWPLVFGLGGLPELGVRGAAIASVTTQSVSFLILALYAALSRHSRRFHLFRRFWRPDWAAFGALARQGAPIGVTGLAESGLFVAAGIMMGWIGTVELAAHGIAIEIAALAFMLHLGLSNAVTVRIGRTWGEGDLPAMRATAMAAVLLSLTAGLAVVTLFLTLPEVLVGLFIDPAKADAARILKVGAGLLSVAALFQLFDAMQVIGLGLLRGVQDTGRPMWIAIPSYWCIGIPTSYFLAFYAGFGAPGLWLGLVAGLATAGILLMTRFWRGPWLGGRPAA